MRSSFHSACLIPHQEHAWLRILQVQQKVLYHMTKKVAAWLLIRTCHYHRRLIAKSPSSAGGGSAWAPSSFVSSELDLRAYVYPKYLVNIRLQAESSAAVKQLLVPAGFLPASSPWARRSRRMAALRLPLPGAHRRARRVLPQVSTHMCETGGMSQCYHLRSLRENGVLCHPLWCSTYNLYLCAMDGIYLSRGYYSDVLLLHCMGPPTTNRLWTR